MANDLPNPKSRNEEILTNLINGESVSDIRPKSRIEVLLKKLAEHGGTADIPPEVTSAIETNGMGWTDEDETVHKIDEKYIPSIDLSDYALKTDLEQLQKKVTRATVTLAAASWSNKAQTVTVQGILADETAQLIQPVPASASQAAYYDAGVLATGQAVNSLTFSCEEVPTADLTVYVVITEVSA